MQVKVKKLNESALLPTKGSEFAAGSDLYANISEPLTIEAHQTRLVPTGLSIELPINTVGLIYARSGLASKVGLAPANKVGVIDCDYRGEVMVALHNHTNETKTINSNERIAQLVVMPYFEVSYVESDSLSETVRSEGGFGSSGK